MRIAAIDIGTNSIHMVIARAISDKGFDVVDREREVVQVGRGSFQGGRLRADAIRRTVEALARYVALARRHQVDRIVCTATAAVREARNGGDFLQAARDASGITPRVIPPEVEGQYIYLGVRGALQLDEQPALIVDIGGGSMQLCVGDRDALHSVVSAPLGALRLTETMLESDPPSRRDLQRLRRHIRGHAKEALGAMLEHEPVKVYGSSGSIHALAQAAHWAETGEGITRINGHELSMASLDTLMRWLQPMTLEARQRVPGIDAQRAEIIVPGAMVLRHILKQAGAAGITISDFGVREGLVMDFMAVHAREISTLGSIDDMVLRSVLELLSKFERDDSHPRHVAHLATSLFDGLSKRHKLGPEARDLLLYASILHDVGSTIGYDKHTEHSAYIIRNGMLRGLSADQVEVIASVARYHGKRRPRPRDAEYSALPKSYRQMVRWLSAILRIAEGLDRSHYQLVQAVRVVVGRTRLSILAQAKRGAHLELWASERRTKLLERVSGMPVSVRNDRSAKAARAARRPVANGKRVAKKSAPRSKVIPLRARR